MKKLSVGAAILLTLAACGPGADPASVVPLDVVTMGDITGGVVDTNRGDGAGPDVPAKDVVEPPEPPYDPCTDGVVVSAVVDLDFSDRGPGCDWNENGNLGLVQGSITARDEDTLSPELPGGAEAICGVSFDTYVLDEDFIQTVLYDDHFLFTVNDVIVASSYYPWLSVFEKEGDLYLYDWDRLAGYDFDFGQQANAFCMGYGSDGVYCTFPSSDQYGDFALSFGGAMGTLLSERVVGEQRLDLSFVTVGDNDYDTDCRHTPYRMRLMVEYALAP